MPEGPPPPAISHDPRGPPPRGQVGMRHLPASPQAPPCHRQQPGEALVRGFFIGLLVYHLLFLTENYCYIFILLFLQVAQGLPFLLAP